MNNKPFKKINYKGQIISSKDILFARNKVKESAQLLGIKKPRTTVLTTAASNIFRIFLDSAEQVQTEIYNTEDSNFNSLSIHISGTLKNSANGERGEEIKKIISQKIQNFTNIFLDINFKITKTNDFELILKFNSDES